VSIGRSFPFSRVRQVVFPSRPCGGTVGYRSNGACSTRTVYGIMGVEAGRSSTQALSAWEGNMKIQVANVSVIVLTFAMAAPASAQGCPWCTTPTTCTLVDEHAAGACKVTAHEGCTSAGVCVINDTYAPTSAAARHFA